MGQDYSLAGGMRYKKKLIIIAHLFTINLLYGSLRSD